MKGFSSGCDGDRFDPDDLYDRGEKDVPTAEIRAEGTIRAGYADL